MNTFRSPIVLYRPLAVPISKLDEPEVLETPEPTPKNTLSVPGALSRGELLIRKAAPAGMLMLPFTSNR